MKTYESPRGVRAATPAMSAATQSPGSADAQRDSPRQLEQVQKLTQLQPQQEGRAAVHSNGLRLLQQGVLENRSAHGISDGHIRSGPRDQAQLRALTAVRGCVAMLPPTQNGSGPMPVQLKQASEVLKDSDALFKINEKLGNRYATYKGEIKSWTDESIKKKKAEGLLHWATHYQMEAAGSDAELRRALYHENNWKTNQMSLGTSNTNQPDLHGQIGGKTAGRSRAEEVKAVTSADPGTVKSRLNDAILQLANQRSAIYTDKKAVVYVYNDRNPFPYDRIQDAKGKSPKALEARLKQAVSAMHQKSVPGLQVRFVDINQFDSSGQSVHVTLEVDWPGSAEKTPTERKKDIKTAANTDSPYRKTNK
jgi:hypothetical protein